MPATFRHSFRSASLPTPFDRLAMRPPLWDPIPLSLQLGLWCFVRERVDVCIVEVGMGGRFDATNVLLPPVACGVSMLDLDHTQVVD